MWLVFCYTIQLITIKLCTKFQNPNQSSCKEIFDEKISLQTNRQTDRQTNIITEKAKTIYPLYTSYHGYKYSKKLQNFGYPFKRQYLDSWKQAKVLGPAVLVSFERRSNLHMAASVNEKKRQLLNSECQYYLCAKANEPRHETSNNVVCATNKASHQPGSARLNIL